MIPYARMSSETARVPQLQPSPSRERLAGVRPRGAARPAAERAAWAALIVVLLVPIWWGAHAQYPWDVDNIAPGSILKAMAARFGPGWSSSYGPVPYLLAALVYAPILAAFKLAGELGQPSAVYPWGFAHPGAAVLALVIAARLVNVAMALGIVALAVRDDRRGGDDAARWVIPVLFAGSAVFAYYARCSNVDIQYLFWLWLGFHLVEHPFPTPRRLALAAAAAMLAVCTKEQSAPLAAVVVIAAFVRALARDPDTRGARRNAALLVLLAAALTYALAWRLPWAMAGWLRHHHFIFEDARYARTYPLSLGGTLALGARAGTWLPLVLGPALVVGLAAALALRVRWDGLGLRAAACALYLAVFLVPIGYVYPRFLLPLLLLAVPLGMRAVRRAGRRAPSRAWSRAVPVAAAVLALAGGPVLSAVMLADPRLAAERWLRETLRDGQLVEVAGNPHFQARVPAGLRRLETSPDSLRNAPRGPRGDVVLLSSTDAYAFEGDPAIRARWTAALGEGAAYPSPRRFAPPAAAWLVSGLPVAPTITAWLRNDARAARTSPPAR